MKELKLLNKKKERQSRHRGGVKYEKTTNNNNTKNTKQLINMIQINDKVYFVMKRYHIHPFVRAKLEEAMKLQEELSGKEIMMIERDELEKLKY